MSTLFLLFWTFFKISLFSIGGGYNMIPLMQHEVETRGWLPPGRFMDLLAISEATPGPIAVNLATFAGYQVDGVPGSVTATAGVCLPGALLLLVLGALALRMRERTVFRAAMRGLMPALTGLLAATALRLGTSLVPPGSALPPASSLLIFFAALGLVLSEKISPPLLLLGAAVAGLFFSLV